MFPTPGTPLSPAEFAIRLDVAKARAAALREAAMREFLSSIGAAVAAAWRRARHAVAAPRRPRAARLAASSAR